MTKNLYNKKALSAFMILFIVLLFFCMSIKNRNGMVSSYDLVLCCTTYSYMTVYLIVPYLFIDRLKNIYNYNYLIRHKNIDIVWLKGCGRAVVWAFEFTVYIFISLWVINFIVSDKLCNWREKNSVFFMYTQCEINKIPSLSTIVIPAVVVVFLNIFLIELITYVCYWYTGIFLLGYACAVIVYIIPILPFVKINIYGLGLFYSDYCVSENLICKIIKRAAILICVSLVIVISGLIKRKKDFIK